MSAKIPVPDAVNEVGMGDARIGIPCNLLPIGNQEHMLPKILSRRVEPTFESYTEGLTAWGSSYYLRALAIHGLSGHAKKLAHELAAGYAAGIVSGCEGTGAEYRSWEGLPTGYEGALIGTFGSLYAIAIEEGIFDAPNPEWWPVNG
jgi:hypothetical protein